VVGTSSEGGPIRNMAALRTRGGGASELVPELIGRRVGRPTENAIYA